MSIAAAKPLDKGKCTLNCVPDPRWPAPERHEECYGWVNPGVEVTHCSCDCHATANPRKSYRAAHERAWGSTARRA